MNLELKNKTALVTGSTGGIGFAIADLLYKEGARVIVNGRTQERVSAAMKAIAGTDPSRIAGLAVDVSTAEGAKKLTKEFPEVDILVNNFGVFEAKAVEELTDEDFSKMFELNVVSGIRLSQHYLKSMKAKNFGRVIFISSESGVNVPPDMIHYGVSKSAQIAVARGLAETTAGTGVTVNSVLPGPTRSEGVVKFLDSVFEGSTKPRAELEAEFVTKLRPSSLIKRFAGAEEVAPIVAFLASPLSAATNGAALRVEGGLLRGIL